MLNHWTYVVLRLGKLQFLFRTAWRAWKLPNCDWNGLCGWIVPSQQLNGDERTIFFFHWNKRKKHFVLFFSEILIDVSCWWPAWCTKLVPRYLTALAVKYSCMQYCIFVDTKYKFGIRRPPWLKFVVAQNILKNILKCTDAQLCNRVT